jgi:hypothetical protein
MEYASTLTDCGGTDREPEDNTGDVGQGFFGTGNAV